jgi:ABC-type Fe3+/spermidine/putrescine transport system ATPase subunit
VADFLAVENILEATVAGLEGGVANLRLASGHGLAAADDGGFPRGAAVLVGVRAARLRLEGPPGPAGALAGTLEDEVYRGDATEWHVRVGPLRLVVTETAARAQGRRRGEAVAVTCEPSAVLRLDSA